MSQWSDLRVQHFEWFVLIKLKVWSVNLTIDAHDEKLNYLTG